jgi:GNAT superfamily N-acetyltransferase
VNLPAEPPCLIRAATVADVPQLHDLICELAEYEKLRDTVTATHEHLRDALFGPRPCAEAVIAEVDGSAVGFALFMPNYSTFLGSRGVYLEDLYVKPQARSHGIGRALLSCVAKTALERGCGKMEWAALDWNEPAIRFYENLGARRMAEWRLFRLMGDALVRVAQPAGGNTT